MRNTTTVPAKMPTIMVGLFSVFFSMQILAQHTLEVLVTGADANKGQIMLAVFASKEVYLDDPTNGVTLAVNELGQAKFVLENLSAGRISVSAIYDEDSDGELDTGFLGIPSERVGFSNNAKSRFGPPSFRKTSFDFPETSKIEIQLINAKD